MFDRMINLIGQDKYELIKQKTVAIIGIGGVGTYSLETIIRSGIENIIIVDYDTFDITNINRQLYATTNTIGKKKIEVAKKRALEINPKINVITIDKKLDNSNIEELFNYKIDYIIDACDDINLKKLLITNSIKIKIKLISSTGTGNKLDPTSFKITDIRKTSYDPIAKILRKYIKENNIKEKIMVVSSIEKPKKTNKVNSISYVPSVVGIYLTSYVINDIIK